MTYDLVVPHPARAPELAGPTESDFRLPATEAACPSAGPSRLLTARELETYIPRSERTLRQWAQRGWIPSIKLSGTVLFDLDEVVSVLRQHRRGSTGDPETHSND